MSPNRGELAERAAQLRAEFDASFAESPAPVVLDLEDVLAVRIGDEERVIFLDEVARVMSRPELTALPTAHPAMIGVVSDRGSVAAAWDLGQLFGQPAQNPYWLVIPAAEPGVAIAFEHFTGFRRVDPAQIRDDQKLHLSDLIETIRGLVAGVTADREG
ncbi:chemotaxis protein CheW [Kineosporia sp. NBRC 101731]|uniref:chemotaxis protein CheW n=1 Tax=Kineosporia sp. NBRC 101731 TaxID=3032199 RepID=UPI00249FCF23|nr:chemotaxis protein CheW [Kineosporia sp. NBRC 101731]GLY31397.1 hypothetical protein Kisp02_47620 [Kineosporia sp. NBRC 101731]